MIMELPQYAPNMVKSTIRNCWYHRGTHAHACSIGRILLTTYNCQRVSRTKKKSGRNAHAREREFAAHCKKCDSKVFDHLCIHKLHVYARTPNQIHTHISCVYVACVHIFMTKIQFLFAQQAGRASVRVRLLSVCGIQLKYLE